MPPKAKITKEMVIDTAFEVAREAGGENINARIVAKKLNCSTQPVMYHFATIEELKRAAYAKADKYHTDYLMNLEKKQSGMMLGIGINYIRFAIKEPHLFRFLFQSGYAVENSLLEMIDSEELVPVLSAMQGATGLGMDETKKVFLTISLFSHGYASIIANNSLEYDEELIKSHLERAYRGAILAVQEEMKKQQFTGNKKMSAILTLIGISIMILLTVTKVAPSSTIAGYSVLVGIAFFFITEAVSKTRGLESGLRFNTIVADLKKPGVIIWVLLPGVSGIVALVVGNLIFSGEFVAHVMGRTSSILSFDKAALLIGQVIITAFGEEIAYRGFFFGKSQKLFPILVSAVVSSAVFAAGHIAIGNIGIVSYDIAGVFIDSLIFSVIYQKSGNCVISTFSHILGNAISLVAVFVFLR